jgi:hypothetical protein
MDHLAPATTLWLRGRRHRPGPREGRSRRLSAPPELSHSGPPWARQRACTDNRCYNELVTALRAPAERANALLGGWRALERVTVYPQHISAIAASALVLTSLDRGKR